MARAPREAPSKAAAVAAGAATVNTENVTHYKVKVREPFLLHQVLFRPGEVITVSKRVYDGQLNDARNFKDLCTEAAPVLSKETLP